MIYGNLCLKFHPQQSAVWMKTGRFHGCSIFPGRIVQLESLAPGQTAASIKQQCRQGALAAL